MLTPSVLKGADGLFYVVPISAGLTGMSWKKQNEAEQVVHALKRAYEMGKEDVRREFRSLLNVAEGDECQ